MARNVIYPRTYPRPLLRSTSAQPNQQKVVQVGKPGCGTTASWSAACSARRLLRVRSEHVADGVCDPQLHRLRTTELLWQQHNKVGTN